MLNSLPSTAKVFIFQADRILTEADKEVIKTQMKTFIPQWATHGDELTAEFNILHDLFLVVGTDESKVQTSGCSKDSLTHVVQKIGERLNIDFFNRLNTVYQNRNGEFKFANMNELKKLMQKDQVAQHTKVFNNLIETKTDLENNWLVEIKKSWHKNLISIV